MDIDKFEEEQVWKEDKFSFVYVGLQVLEGYLQVVVMYVVEFGVQERNLGFIIIFGC